MKSTTIIATIHDQLIGPDLITKANLVDPNANGVQIWGENEVDKIALGVSCNLEFLHKAVNWGAQLCLFHHGLGLNNHYIYNSRLDLPTQKQLQFIFQNELTIAAYHFPLDIHETLGNNAQIIKALGAKRLNEPYFEIDGTAWGWLAEFAQARAISDLAQVCSRLFKHDVFMVLGGPEKVTRLGVCSGGAKPSGSTLFELAAKKVDLHLTGEIAERGPSLAKESGFNYFACGHYATEVFGIKALGAALQKKFPKVPVQFFEVWNEV